MTSQCAWCHPPGSPSHDDTASHGMCPRHAREHLLIEPLLTALATLRGPSFMGDDAKAKCARLIDTVVSRLSRPNLVHLFGDPESPAPAPSPMSSVPADGVTEVTAPGDIQREERPDDEREGIET